MYIDGGVYMGMAGDRKVSMQLAMCNRNGLIATQVLKRGLFIPTNANNCRLQSITSERIGNSEPKAAIKCVHEYKSLFK